MSNERKECWREPKMELPGFAQDEVEEVEEVDVVVEEVPEDVELELFISNCPGDFRNCKECCDVLNNPVARSRFGVQTSDVPKISCTCHDICVQEAKLFCVQPIPTFTCPFTPGVDNGCRGIVCDGVPVSCNVVVTRADEVLCTSTCDRVNFCVEYVLEVAISGCPQPVCLFPPPVTGTCNVFFPFPTGAAISGTALREEMRKIDGSCLVVNIDCIVTGNTVIASGNIVEKLWKHENLWVTALNPYPNTVTIKKEFPPIPTCTSPPCPTNFFSDDA